MGQTPPLPDDLEAHLLAHPDDADAALVLADQLQAAGDPRGELIALEHAIARAAQPSLVPPLEARLVELLRQQRARLFDRPGGFPFRARWRGRSYISYNAGSQLLGEGTPAHRYARLLRFFDELTDSTGPDEIVAPRHREVDLKLTSFGYAATPHAAATIYRRAARTRRLHEIVGDLVEAWPAQSAGLSLRYRFHLAQPWSGVALPYQNGIFSAGGRDADLASELQVIDLFTGMSQLHLTLPFLDFGAAFVRYHDEIVARLPGCFTAPFHHHTPAEGRDSLDVNLVPFDRATSPHGSKR